MDMRARLAKVRERTTCAGCGALVVSNLVNIRYLTGFSGSAGRLFVSGGDAVLLTDGRYGTQAPAEIERAGSGDAVRVHVAAEPEQLEILTGLARRAGVVGLEADHISWSRQRQFGEQWGPRCELIPTRGLVEELRALKDPGELGRIGAAAAVADAALERVAPMLRAGVSEVEVAVALDSEMRRLGAAGPSFDTIVATGPNAAEPHHRPGASVLQAGDVVVVDFGAEVDGYRSDMTRTFVVGGGSPSAPEMKEVIAIVRASQEAGLAAVAPGARTADVDAACRAVMREAGVVELFVHGTGHGVGLEIHEPPWLGASTTDILQAGQVVTVEPGAYLPGVGGARIEDTVVVTEEGCRPLTLTPKTA